MRITGLGHAGLRVETRDVTLLIDPWFSPEGAFQASWFQYPENFHLLTPALLRPTAIVISHEHMDHVDPWFLAAVSSDVPAVVPRYSSPALKRKIALGGPRPVIEAEQWERVEVGEDTRVFFVSEPPMNHDSAIVVEGDGHILLDLNDARLFPVQLRQIRQSVGGHLDAFSFQGAGASWYPMCYRYSKERAAHLSRQKRIVKLAYCSRSMKILEPTVGLPFAGPPAFLDPELFRFNKEMEGGIFPDQGRVAAWLRGHGYDNVAVLLPGDSWDVDLGGKECDPCWSDFSFNDRWSYLGAYAGRRRPTVARVRERHPEPSESLWEPFREYFEVLLGKSTYFNAHIGMRVGFDIQGPGGGRWSVDFTPGREGVNQGMGECGYIYRLVSRWLPSILSGATPWEDFFLSLRFEATRDPDVYNDHLLGLLKFAHHDALAAVESFETSMGSEERIVIRSERGTYSVQRYCPHAGNDLLTTGEVLPGGILRCLAHHYEFDLATGACLNGNCPALAVERVGEASSERASSVLSDGDVALRGY